MKLQDVILKTIAKKWSYFDAAEIGGISVSRLAWIIEQYRKQGYTGIRQYRAGRLVRHNISLEHVEQILALYPSLGSPTVPGFRKLLARDHGIKVEQEWLGAVLAGAGMISTPTPLPRSRVVTMGRKAREKRLAFPDFYPKASSHSKSATRRTA